MTRYPSEFQNGTGFDAVEPDVFFSLSPVLLAAFLLLLALAILLTWFARDLFRRREPEAADDIWTAINTACLSAMGANSDQLLTRAKALREEITARLGPVLVLAEGLNKPVKTLDTAIKGKTTDKPAGTPAEAGPAASPHVTVLQNSHIVVRGEERGTLAGPPDPPPPLSPPADRDMTDVERATALRSAIGGFHDHWSQRTLRLDELRDARRALCHTPPLSQPAHH